MLSCGVNESGGPFHLIHASRINEKCRDFTQDSSVILRASRSLLEVSGFLRGSSNAVERVARGERRKVNTADCVFRPVLSGAEDLLGTLTTF